MNDLYIEEFLTNLQHDPNYNLYDLDNSISMDDLIHYRKNSQFENYNELIDTIGLILADSSRKSSLGQKARERASGAFTWQSIASRYREHMVSLIS